MIRSYSAHEKLVASARRRPELWRILVGVPVIAALVIAGASLFWVGLAAFGSLERFITASDTAVEIVMLGLFAVLTIAVAVTLRMLHARPLSSAIGETVLAGRQFVSVFWRLSLLLPILFALPPNSFGRDLVANLPFSVWLGLLPLSLGVVLIQTSAEEILFRGYLQQSLAARFSRPWVWIGIPSAMFALAHYDPRFSPDIAVIVMLWAGVFGLCTADLTARAGTLGPAMAIHFFNNIVAILIVALPGDLSSLALFHLPFGADDPEILRKWLLVDLILIGVFWLIGRLAIRR